MSPRYTVTAYDQAGEYRSTQCDSLRLARMCRTFYKDRWPDKVVEVHDGEQDGRALEPEELEGTDDEAS